MQSIISAIRLVFLTVILLGLQPGVLRSALQTDSAVVITRISIIPMTKDTVLADQTVVVEKKHITQVGTRASIQLPNGAKVIDGHGKFLIPGLSDMHAHLRHQDGKGPEDYLRQGVTVVRNMQGEPSHLTFRAKVKSGEVPGPLLWTTGPIIAGKPRLSPRHVIPETPDEAREIVREHHKLGYDFIKVYSLLDRATYDAILETAHDVGIPVVGHVPDDVRATHAIQSGQSSVEHFFGYFWELESDDSEILGKWHPRRLFHAVTIDDEKIPNLAERTAKARVWNCPTLWRKDNYLTHPMAKEAWENPALSELAHTNRMKLVKALHEAGAGLLTGTDDAARIIHEELKLFVEAGLTPFEVLRLSTVSAAEYLNATEAFGTVEVGKLANLVLLSANPLDDISNTASIVGVLMRGVWIPTNDD